ncbi:nitroreductase family protein [Catenuloplanes atrovinosus]|uniref:SagB-type dehydrogenase family enzyme n=1 Tax=Catenuloplanes atrovinosus TaxID=137266 RepID=A0AAE3YNY2_9ACTN|nr:nitroreductase family protein [Catenuloplanes atrovinosus]MDR7275589.1 SagB-type dehydrogenase family enzyme [Catenuloplanes atrovinosus]
MFTWVLSEGILLENEAVLYHELTAYSRDRHWLKPISDERILRGFRPLSQGRRPWPDKRYDAALDRVSLPAPAAAATAGLDLAVLSRLLNDSAGMRTAAGRGELRFRAASSAGNRHPIESYVCARGITGLPDGVWHYDAAAHRLVLVGPAPRGECAALLLTGVPWRTCWRYAERGYRHLWWDAGSQIANLSVVADHLRVPATVRLGFADADAAALVGAETPWELPLVAVTLGRGEPALEASGPAEPGDLGPDHTSFPLIDMVHDATTLADSAAARAWTRAIGGGPSGTTSSLVPFIAGRRSAGRFVAGAHTGAGQLHQVLDLAAAELHWDGDVDVDLHVIVHTVRGIAPGLYRWHEGTLQRVPADIGPHDAYELAVRQDPARDAAFVLLLSCDLRRLVAGRGARAYRAVQLAAGVVVGRAYLAAAAAGLGCRALTFNDDVLARMLPASPAGLLLAAVGVPGGKD